MDALQIKTLIDAMASSDLTELEASKDGWTLRLVRGVTGGVTGGVNPGVNPGAAVGKTLGKAPTPASATAAAGRPAALQTPGDRADGDPIEQHASLCGTVFLQPAPGEPAFVEPGQAVKAGQTLCVIEAMKVFNEVAAERDGVVDAFLVTSGQDIDAGQPLVRLR